MKTLLLILLLAVSAGAYGQCSPLISIPDSFALRMQNKTVGINTFYCNVDTNNIFWVDPNSIPQFPTDFGYITAVGWLPDTVCIWPERFFQGTVQNIYTLQKPYIAMRNGEFSFLEKKVVTGNTTYVLPAGHKMLSFDISSVSNENISVDIVPAGTAILNAWPLVGGSGLVNFYVNRRYATATTFYFTGITSTTTIYFTTQ